MTAHGSRDDSGNQDAPSNSIAIIGMAGRFPGAADVAQFWQNLLDGVEAVTWFTDDELRAAGESERNLRNPSYVRANPVLKGIDQFDAGFFGFSPKDAAIMDPAHRIFLEVAWHAFEHAGRTALPHEGAVGVFATSGASLYLMDHLRTNPHLLETVGEFLLRHTGNDQSFLATRVSYELDLRGPSINVQTACSSALVAVYMASQSLLSGECDLALAGGSTILLPQGRGYVYQDGEIMSRDGHCRPFDAQATGTLFGSGAGAVVLARLSDAIANRDTIYAVIRGAAINNDGSVKVGYLAPSVDAQAACIAEALALSGVDPETISYVEAHGTATRVGDPIEVTALTQAFQRFTRERGFCGLGSVKSNVGHLGEAAAVPGLIKTALALHHGVLPASLGYTAPNEQIDFPSTPFVVNAARRTWQPRAGIRRAGITALGAGGTNCHIVLEQAPPREASEATTHPELVVVSAKSHEALDALCESLAEALEAPGPTLADAAHTLQVGRRALSHRAAFVARSREEAVASLRAREAPRFVRDVGDDQSRRVAFLFPGGGAQYPRMGAELYEQEPVYRDAFESCLACLDSAQAATLRTLILTPQADAQQAGAELARPSRTLPALFATEYAFAQLLQSWGMTPDALGGHSMGEYVAACLAGVFSVHTAMQLVALRGRLFERAERGGMLAVQLSAEALRARMPAGLDMAAVNGPALCVASGPVALLDELAAALQRDGIDSTRVHIDVAAHSALLDPFLPEFRAFLRSVQFSPPKKRFVSNLTGTWITEDEAMDPEYWVKHLRSTVQFAACLETLFAAGIDVLVEVGPGNTLSNLGRLQTTRPRLSCNTMRHPQEVASDHELALRTLGRLWTAGVSIEWQKLRGDELRNRVALPAYPFQHASYWIEPGQPIARANIADSLRKRTDEDQWYSTLSWTRAPAPVPRPATGAEHYLVFTDKAGVGKALARRLGNDRVTAVVPGRALIRRSTDEYEIDPNDPSQFERLVQELHEHGRGPTRVVYMWTLGVVDELLRSRSLAKAAEAVQRTLGSAHDFASSREACFAAPFHLCRSLGAYGTDVELTVVTSAAHQLGEEIGEPRKALALGPVLVAPHEFPALRTRLVDVAGGWIPGRTQQRVLDQLEREIAAPVEDRVVALRGPDRWVRRIEPCRLPAFDAAKLPLSSESCVVISGGLGGIGLEIAGALAETPGVTLVLLGRTVLPEPAARDRWLESHPADDATSVRIIRLRALEQRGARVHVRSIDVTDPSALRALFDELQAGGTPVTGIIHGAGTVDDALMLEKKLPDAWRVMAAKVEGVLALDVASTHLRLDFFVAFSSVASFLGLPGQSDYTAANAFLDAFAARREALGRGRTFVVNWNAWSEVGMAAALKLPRAQSELARLRIEPSHQADLEGFVRTRDGLLFFCDLSVASHWVVGEHRVRGGLHLVPGTGHLELIAAAYRQASGQAGMSIRDVRFLSPFQLEGSQPKRLYLRMVSAAGDEFEVRIFGDDESSPCVTASVGPLEIKPLAIDVAAVRARSSRIDEIGGFMRQSFVDFGPRWSNLVRTHYGTEEALIELELSAALSGDLNQHPFHPALADMATGSVQHLVPGFDPATQFFVPFSYEQVDLFAPLQSRLVSHVRYTGGASGETAVFDVSIASPDGRVLADAHGFTMRRVGKGASIVDDARSSQARAKTSQAERVDELLATAITPAEGVRAFQRVLAGFVGSQCTVSSVDPALWMRQLDAEAQRMSEGGAERPKGFARPNLGTPYRAPETPEQELVARIWSELLGIQTVGIDDDFNELGGQSLLAIRMVERIRKETGTAISLSTLFDAPTVARIASKISIQGGGTGPVTHHSIMPIREGGRHAPLFMPHGVGGTVHWGYANIAKHLKSGVPIIGLKVAPAECTTFEDMCAFYVKEMRSVQPEGPYYLGGYCYGGNVAFEIARQLRDAGDEVGLLALIEAWPVNTGFGKVEWTPSYAARFAENLPYFASDFMNRPGRDQLESVRGKLVGLGRRLLPAPALPANASPTAHDSMFDRLGPPPSGANLLDVRSLVRYGEGEIDTWERCIRALWAYVPPAIDVHGLVIRTRRQPLFSPHEVEMGWGPLLKRGLDAHTIPGSHFTVMDVRDVVAVARLLDAALD